MSLNYERAKREIAELRDHLPGKDSVPDPELVEELIEQLRVAYIRVGEVAEETGDIFDERVDAACEDVREAWHAIREATAGQPLYEVFDQGPADMLGADPRVRAGTLVDAKRVRKGMQKS